MAKRHGRDHERGDGAGMGFLPVHYPRVAGTVAQIDSRLLLSGFVYRFVASKLHCLGRPAAR